MIKSKKQMYVIIGAFILTLLLGTTTYAFFNYTRTGGTNIIRTGRIAFNASQDGNINLTNAFPINSQEAQTDATNAKLVAITVTGDTDYSEGLEYLVTASDVNLTVGSGASAKQLPIALEVSVSSNTHGEAPNQTTTTLGTEETGDYYANRSSYTVSKYKVLYDGELEEDARILVGYIAPNTVAGTPLGIDGTINIKAYIDSSKILISDTYPSGYVDTNNDNVTDYTNGTPSSMAEGKIVFTTEEWNGIQGSPLSFKVKVEANEGIWVYPLAIDIINNISGLAEIAGAKRYVGSSPNNYVIFNNEQWRIIGVYNKNLKIMKADALVSNYKFNNQGDGNTWEGSLLEETLNGSYYNNLSSTAQEMIDTKTWNVGGTNSNSTAIETYSQSQLNTWEGKVGLLATYEFLYAASDNTCYTVSDGFGSYSTNCGRSNINWINSNSGMWTISKSSFNNATVDYVYCPNGCFITIDDIYREKQVVPVVYLKTGVTITGGTGESGGNEYTLGYTAN